MKGKWRMYEERLPGFRSDGATPRRVVPLLRQQAQVRGEGRKRRMPILEMSGFRDLRATAW